MSGTVHRRNARPHVWVWPPERGGAVLDLSGDVVAFNCQKQMAAPAGQFSVTLVPRTELDPHAPANLNEREVAWFNIEPNSVVSIGMDRPGGIMVGLVSSVTRSTLRAGGTVHKAVTITGEDFGKLLVQDNVEHSFVTVAKISDFTRKIEAALGPRHPLVTPMRGLFGPSKGEDGDSYWTFLDSTVSEVVDWILDEVVSFRVPAFIGAAGGTGHPREFFGVDVTPGWADQKIWSEAPNEFTGSVFNFIRSVLDADLYEFWVDTIPTTNGDALAVPTIIVRPKPFDEPVLDFAPVTTDPGLSWASLRTRLTRQPAHEIHEDEILEEQVTRSDRDAVSFYLVRSNHVLLGNPEGEREGLSFPAVDTWAARKFGLRSYRADLSLVGPDLARKSQGDAPYTTDVAAEVVEQRSRLLNWFRLNSEFESGTIRVWGRDHYRVGDKVHLDHAKGYRGTERGLDYYTVGVAWDWKFGGHYTTTLTLDRGHNDEIIADAKRRIAEDAPSSNPSHLAET